MSSMSIACLMFVCVFGCTMLAMFLGRLLPEHHLRPESKEAVKVGLGFIATLSALVLGLLVASAKATYDAQNSAVRQMAADIILLDRALALYGPETKDAQNDLRQSVALVLNRLWPEDAVRPGSVALGEARPSMEVFYNKVAALTPQNNAQRTLQARALDITANVGQTRLRLFAQKESSIPVPFLVVLVFWLSILFAGYGLMAPRNATVIVAQLVCTLSVAGALFLILEMDRPFEGVVHLPSAPLQEALAQIGK